MAIAGPSTIGRSIVIFDFFSPMVCHLVGVRIYICEHYVSKENKMKGKGCVNESNFNYVIVALIIVCLSMSI